ncbi:helix-turn-helix transcriptional regulator [Desulfoluna spongiiphila]|uniref:DNA-binding response regulator, NarL/FixJ family, contains REC and HTH domains n=1 Tax=Desulfoluna spongiiphila TaxID=419481 RepID=A0A1G5IZQ8_9BACT|nr:response regulator transcription factor [Desulfoluna spongiiphila]SCY81200.1 DNA-binding response regulator, NarL/FixJ family, contains REC and HTH domains [Desulfoluna spongiiphila]
MICVCSTDRRWVDSLAGLPLVDDTLVHVAGVGELSDMEPGSVSVLLIDLKSCGEEDLASIEPPMIALAERPLYDQGMRLLRRGVRGYGNRHMHRDNLVQAVTAVKGGQVWMPPEFVARMIASLTPAEPENALPETMEPLSRREKEVAGFVAEGLSNREIADKMAITVRTVKAHLTSIFAKTGFRDRLELAVKMKKG